MNIWGPRTNPTAGALRDARRAPPPRAPHGAVPAPFAVPSRPQLGAVPAPSRPLRSQLPLGNMCTPDATPMQRHMCNYAVRVCGLRINKIP